MQPSEDFYSGLPVRDGFLDIADLTHYTALPDDWCVVAADVRNSTIAISNGHYKAVNITGAAVITSVLNAVKPLHVPYIFGGDGATICFPAACTDTVRKALVMTSRMAKTQFNLHLRIGIVPLSVIHEAGRRVLVARHRVSRHYVQAAFSGGGVEYAEDLIKDDATDTPYRLSSDAADPEGEFTGLECRWDSVPSRHGETISLIVKVNAASDDEAARINNEIIRKVHEIYGDEDICRPVYESGIHATLRSANLQYEYKMKTDGAGLLSLIRFWLFLRYQVVLGWILMRYKIRTGDIYWGNYKQDLVTNSDFRKFDGVLRQVLSGTRSQRELLTAYLQERYLKGDCCYGIHVSNAALITCLVLNRTGDHFHFIDGADGGYAMAATGLKKQLKETGTK